MTRSSLPRLSRRDVVMGAGAALLAAPYVRIAKGAPAGPPRRTLIVFIPLGTVHELWLPTMANGALVLPKLLAPLEPFKSELLVLDGVDNKLAIDNGICDHAAAGSLLTGFGRVPGARRGQDPECVAACDGVSVDQYLAAKLGAATPFQSMELAATNNGNTEDQGGAPSQFHISQTGPRAQVIPETVPQLAFNRFFGSLLLSKADLAKIQATRRSVLDVANADLKQLAATRLGAEEKVKLDGHLAGLRELEKKVAPASAGCTPPGPPSAALPQQPNAPAFNDLFPAVAMAHMDLVTAAFACDLTRVATLNLFTIGARFSWLKTPENHHELSHGRINQQANPTARGYFVADKVWTAEAVAYLLGKLKGTPDPLGGSLLDNTAVYWVSEISGSTATDHLYTNLPVVIAGQAGGYFKTGRLVQYGSQRAYDSPGDPKAVYSGVNHQRLLVTMCQAMGLPDSTFGDPAYGTGPLDRLTG